MKSPSNAGDAVVSELRELYRFVRHWYRTQEPQYWSDAGLAEMDAMMVASVEAGGESLASAHTLMVALKGEITSSVAYKAAQGGKVAI